MKADPVLEAYFAEAASWDRDRVAMSTRSMRTAWRIAFCAVLTAIAAIVALVALMPLKRVEPFLIRVDNTTGVIDVVPVLKGIAELPEASIRQHLHHYITVCERFNFVTANSDYEECAAFHAPERNMAWSAQWDRTNPASPLNVHQAGTSVRAQVKSITFFKRGNGVQDLAQIRYTKFKREAGRVQEDATHWISTIQYAYTKPSEDNKKRLWNPVGFKVIDFRPEPEVAPAPLTTGAAR